MLYSDEENLSDLFGDNNVKLVLAHGTDDLICEPSDHPTSDANYWTCLTPTLANSDLLDQRMKIQMKCSNDHYFLNKNFIYKPDPILDGTQNLYSIQQGGIRYVVKGQNMMSVGFPIINIYVEYKDELQEQCNHCTNICSIDTSSQFKCISHEMFENVLPLPIVKDEVRDRKKRGSISFIFSSGYLNDNEDFTRFIRQLFLYAYDKRNATHASYELENKETNYHLRTYNSHDTVDKKVHIEAQFSLDGITSEKFPFLIYKNPTINAFRDRPRDFRPQWPDNEEILKISGRHLRRGASAEDYKV